MRNATRTRSPASSPSSPESNPEPEASPRLKFDTPAARLDSTALAPPALALLLGLKLFATEVMPLTLGLVVSGEAGSGDLGNGVTRAVAKSKIDETRFLLEKLLDERNDKVLSSLRPPLPKTEELFADG